MCAARRSWQDERWWLHRLQRAEKKKEESAAEIEQLRIKQRKHNSDFELQRQHTLHNRSLAPSAPNPSQEQTRAKRLLLALLMAARAAHLYACAVFAVNEACQRNESLQRDVGRLTEEWTAEKQRHARTKQSYARLQEQHSHNAVAHLQPARLHTAPVSPLQSPASAPSHAPQPAAREHYPPHSLPPAAGRSPMARTGAGWGSSSHGSFEYGKEADGRTAHAAAALSSPYHAQMPSGGVMPTHLPSGQAAALDSRRRQLPLHAVHTQQPVREAAMFAASSEQQRYQRERQVHGDGSGGGRTGAGGSATRQAQHSSNEQSSRKRGQQRTSAPSRAVSDSWLCTPLAIASHRTLTASACCVL